MADGNTTSMKVNILFSKETRKILYIEAGKDFVDLLMAFLRMPTVSLLKLLAENGITAKRQVGIFKIFSSASKLDDSFMKVDKDVVMSPSLVEGSRVGLLGFQEPSVSSHSPRTSGHFVCSNASHYSISLLSGAKCATCGNVMNQSIQPKGSLSIGGPFYTCSCRRKVAQSGTYCNNCGVYMSTSLILVVEDSNNGGRLSGGFVKETVTFMVTDDLEFFPSSTIKSISLLNTLGVRSMGDLDSYETTVTKDHALALVQAALTSTTALNDVFGTVLAKRR